MEKNLLLTMEMKKKILELIREQVPLQELIEYLKVLKAKGLEKELAYQSLEKMRTEVINNEEEDVILELMDIVQGFCSPQLLIWE